MGQADLDRDACGNAQVAGEPRRVTDGPVDVAVAPGVVAWPDEGYESDEEAQRAYLSRVPLERAGTPEDAAEAVRWLALDATYTTGQVIRVDGGRFLA